MISLGAAGIACDKAAGSSWRFDDLGRSCCAGRAGGVGAARLHARAGARGAGPRRLGRRHFRRRLGAAAGAAQVPGVAGRVALDRSDRIRRGVHHQPDRADADLRWISALVRASPISGLDRTLGLVFGLVRGVALVILAYIVAGMVLPVERWPEPVFDAESIWPGLSRLPCWVVEQLPVEPTPAALCAAAGPRDHGGGPAAARPRRAGLSGKSPGANRRVLAWP